MAKQQGWKATDRLAPLWNLIPGRAPREQLADAIGMKPTELSSYNSGRKNLGRANGERILRGLGTFGITASLLDLGAPEDEDVPEATTLRGLIRDLAETNALQQEEIDQLRERVARIEAAATPRRRAGGSR